MENKNNNINNTEKCTCKSSSKHSFVTLAGLIIVVSMWAALCIFCFIKPQDDFSDSERRKLAAFPETKAENILSGKFMTDFDSYALDQFPLRDNFRTIKALSAKYLFGMRDNNGIYSVDGYTAKIEYPLNEKSLASAAEKLGTLYNSQIKDKANNVYLSIIPDKGYFLAKQNGFPSLDYDKLTITMRELMPFAKYIDIFPTLELSDYYKTDTHWRQENLFETAEKLCDEMGIKKPEQTTEKAIDVPFYGVYHGQSALPLESEVIKYISSPTIDGCIVTNVETGKAGGVYNMEKLSGKDPYEVFLSGACALLYIDNPGVKESRELVIFRDSFGSSIAPLLLESYSKITIVDTRYIDSSLVGDYVNFENADVLFIYSTMILNTSNMMK